MVLTYNQLSHCQRYVDKSVILRGNKKRRLMPTPYLFNWYQLPDLLLDLRMNLYSATFGKVMM